MILKTNPKNIDIGQFTQAKEGVDRLNWQIPWDEKYLNEEGTIITGDWLNSPKNTLDFTRLAFFLHHIDFKKPLVTQFEALELKLVE